MHEDIAFVVVVVRDLTLADAPHDRRLRIEVGEGSCVPTNRAAVPILVLRQVKCILGSDTDPVHVALSYEASLARGRPTKGVNVVGIRITAGGDIAIAWVVGSVPEEAIGAESLGNLRCTIDDIDFGNTTALNACVVAILKDISW